MELGEERWVWAVKRLSITLSTVLLRIELYITSQTLAACRHITETKKHSLVGSLKLELLLLDRLREFINVDVCLCSMLYFQTMQSKKFSELLLKLVF